MPSYLRPAKLLLCLVGRHRGDQLVDAAKSAGARGGTIAISKGLGDSRLLQALALADVQQEVVMILLGEEKDAVIRAVRAAALESPKKLGGTFMLLDVFGILTRASSQQQQTTMPQGGAGSEHMQSGFELITVIVNCGCADDVMAAARKAGAGGGTILNARGTGTEADVKFFGITLVPEKEMLLIAAPRDKTPAIIQAVNTVPQLLEPGGGIVFTMNIEEFMVLGQ